MTPRGKVVVVGQGYVGLPLAMRASEVGYDVVGFDVDTGRIAHLAAGDSYVGDVPAARLVAALAGGRYRPSADPTDLADFDVAVVTVPTPLRDGAPDLSYIEDASQLLAAYLRAGACVVLESTTYPGTTDELVAPLLEQGSGLAAGTEFHLGYSPERINPGDPNATLEGTPKVVSGIDAASLERVQSFYDDLVVRTVPVSGTREAELTKLLENTFRHVNVALVNELAMFAADLGIDVWEAIDAADTKPFGFMRFEPGPGVGGHCLPIDPSYLAWKVQSELGAPFRFVELANDVNDFMPDYVVRRLEAGLHRRATTLEGARVLILGLAYKPETGDAREAPALRIAAILAARGAVVSAADPYVVEQVHGLDPAVGLTRVEVTPEVLAGVDAVVVVTPHAAFDLAEVVAHAPFVLDTRRRVPPAPNVERL
ncbi:MAG: nucleotide sugar dehydrogenase [Actinomycetes bacterium]